MKLKKKKFYLRDPMLLVPNKIQKRKKVKKNEGKMDKKPKEKVQKKKN